MPGFLDYAVEHLMNSRLAGQGGRGGPLTLLARVVTAAAARCTCSADTLACAARCLAEAGQTEAGLKVRHPHVNISPDKFLCYDLFTEAKSISFRVRCRMSWLLCLQMRTA